MTRADAVALYVDPRGPYPGLVGQWYDAKRDARTYDGQLPVVAHPPCGPWGRLAHLCTLQDPAAGLHAVEVVQRVGGVLEHPVDSKLWRACGLPRPGQLSLFAPGFTIRVEQWRWGHRAVKPSWLYVVGAREVPPLPPPPGARPRGPVSHRVRLADGREVRTMGGVLQIMAKSQRHLTPEPFARWLVELASRCHT